MSNKRQTRRKQTPKKNKNNDAEIKKEKNGIQKPKKKERMA